MNRRLRGARPTPRRAALSVGLGALVGATPLVGLHAALAVPLAALLRLDARLAFLGTNVSLPFVMPVLYGAELAVGAALLGRTPAAVAKGAGDAADVARALALGTAVVAPLVAAAAGALAYGAAARLRRRRARRSARAAPP